MSVRKRSWVTAKGESRDAWIVDYPDAQGTRRLKTFKRKKDADAFAAKTHVEVREGVHVADSASVTVREAGDLWLTRSKSDGLERATLMVYGQHVKYHINPLIGPVKLSQLSIPRVRAFEERLREEGRSPYLVRAVLRSVGAIIADAQERGLVAHNAVREMRSRRRNGSSGARRTRQVENRDRHSLPRRDTRHREPCNAPLASLDRDSSIHRAQGFGIAWASLG